MSDFLARMKSAAKAYKKTIVLPEGEDPRTLEAARKIVAEDLASLVILGDPAKIDVEGVTVIDPTSPTAPKHEAYAQKFAELRAKKGVTIEQARAQMMDATYYGTMMVKIPPRAPSSSPPSWSCAPRPPSTGQTERSSLLTVA